jgi:ABC-type uncharacterized transport system permease subunit
VAFLRRAEGLARVASGSLVAALFLHLLAMRSEVVAHGLSTPLAITSAYAFACLLLAYLVGLRYRFRSALAPLAATPMVVLLASLRIDPAFRPFGTRLDGLAAQLHLGTLVGAYAAFTIAAGLGLMLALRARSLKQKAGGLVFEILPPQRDLDRATVALVEVGLVLLSLSMAFAAVHARTVGWVGGGRGSKLALACAVWIMYAGLSAGRRWGHWRAERVGWAALVALPLALGSFVLIEVLGRAS